MFSMVDVPTYITTSSIGGFLFLHTFPGFGMCRILNDGNSDQCEMIPYCSLDLYFSSN